MAVNPEQFYTGNGTKTDYTFSFEYIDEDDIKVSLDDVVTTAYSFANATTILFDSAPASDVAIRIYRDTNVDSLKTTFFAGSSIRAQDLNKNFEQSNYAVQEIKAYTWDNETDTIHSDETWVSSDTQIATTAAMDARFQDEATETIESGETWVSDNDHIATTAAIDARFQDELDETITSGETWTASDNVIATTQAIENRIDEIITNDIGTDGTGITVTDDGDGTITLGLGAGTVDLDRIKAGDIVASGETWANNDTTVATTAMIDDQIDAAITGDILIDSTGLTKSTSGGQTTLGIGAGSVDLDRIKAGDIITESEQDSGTTETDNNIFTALAAAKRFDTLVQTASPSGSAWEVGKTWLQNDDDLTLSIWNGTGWTAVSSGGTFTEQPSVVYVDQASGDDNNTGHRISTPKATIKAAINQINAEIGTEITSGGSGYVEGSYTTVSLTGGNGTGLTADITVNASGVVSAVTVNSTTTLEDYSIGDVLSASNADLGGSGSGLQITVTGDGDGQIVVVSAGTYQEVAPIQIKRRNVSVIGQALRSCIVHPTVATENNVLFELNSGSYIANLTLTGMQAGTGTGNTLDATLPTTQGWNFAFYEDAFITKSPYIQNCTNFSDSEIDNDDLRSHRPRGGTAGDLDSDPTGGGMLVNGATPHDDSPLRSMVADSYTHVGLNGPGVLVTNNGYAQITSSYAFFNKYHIKCLNGGQANLAASTTDFGDQALVADGRSTNAIFTSTTFADAADQATEFFINGPTARTATPLPWHGSSTRPQSNMLVDIGGNTYPILSASNTFDADEIVSGRDYTILTVGDTDFTAIGAASNTVGVQFTATGVGTGSGTVTDDTGWRVTISRPDPNNRNNNLGLDGAVTSGGDVEFFLRSQVASSGHTMEYVGSGTDYRALPENGGVPDESKQITESNNGKVWTAITDHNGKFKIGGNQATDPIFEVDQQTGFITIPEGSIAFNLLSDATPQLGGDLDVNGNTITGLSNPTANDEVANKAYVDSVAGTPTQIAQLNTSVATSDTGTDGTITFTTDGTTAMTVDNNQRVGVGTTSPSAELHVSDTSGDAEIRMTASSSSGSCILRFGNAADQELASIRTTSGTDQLAFFGFNDVERMRIDSSGRVGIGTSSPSNLLHIAGTGTDLTGLRIVNTQHQNVASTAGLKFGITNSAGQRNCRIQAREQGTDTNNIALDFFTSNADAADGETVKMTIDSNGNVGIGTTSPERLLHVFASDTSITSNSSSTLVLERNGVNVLNILKPNGTAGILSFSGNSTNADGRITYDDSSSRAMEFWTASSERARIDSSGRLLVGTSTSTPGAAGDLFEVAGNAPSAIITSTASSRSVDQVCGQLRFYGQAGANEELASIRALADGTHGSGDKPTRLVLSTTADNASSPTERFRIGSAGQLGIGGANYGTSGQVLTSQGSSAAPQWATVSTSTGNDFNFNDGTLSGSSVTVNGATDLPASAMKIVISFRFVIWSNNSTTFYLRFGNSSGVITSGYASASGFFGATTSGNSQQSNWWMLNQGFGASSARMYGQIELNKMKSNEWHMSCQAFDTTNTAYQIISSGALQHTGTITDAFLAVNTGSFGGGSYGVNVFTE